MTSVWTTANDFGQKIDLCVRLREILRNYPEGLSIFKELIQNADDAGAHVIRFCLSEPRQENLSPDPNNEPLHQIFQGPSLLVYNSGKFTPDDFASIQNIGDSIKKGTEKTGRFGLGFNSTYHLTDVPIFVSGSKVVLFDPHTTFIPGINPINPGKLIDFSKPEGKHLIQSFPRIFAPMEIFGCSFQDPEFDGTLFQFALRSPDQAKVSRLSNRSYTLDSVRSLLHDLTQESSTMLLFLRNVQRIEVYDWKREVDQPVLISYATVCNGDDIRVQRSRIPTLLEGTSQPVDYVLRIESFRDRKKRTEKWVVCNQMGGGNASKLALHPAHAHMKLIPWAGVATRVLPLMTSDSGMAYCFLPLPLKTSLPVHVNGYFELSSNRRDLWWGNDMVGDGKVRADWNKALLQDIATPCYGRLMDMCIRSKHVSEETYECLLPRTNGHAEPWKWLAHCFFKLMSDRPILYSPFSNDWVRPKDAYVLENAEDVSIVRTLPIFHISLILPRKDVMESLLALTGVNTVTLTTVMMEHVVPFLRSVPLETIQAVMRETLIYMRSSIHRDSDLRSFLSTANIIPSLLTNTLKSPSELYDPRVVQLRSLMDLDAFPNENFSDETLLSVLRALGLNYTLTWETIIACARSIEADVGVDKTHDAVNERALELISFLQQNEQSFFPSKRKEDLSFTKRIFRKLNRETIDDSSVDRSSQNDIWIDQLLRIKWIPVLEHPVNQLLPWLEPNLPFAAPIDTATIDNVWFVSSFRYISALTIGSIDIKTRFGWNDRPSIEQVALQLKAFSLKFAKLCDDKDADHNSLCRTISEELPRLYGILNEAQGRDVSVLKEMLGKGFPWLWMGSLFTSSENVAFSCPFNANPYLFVVPSDLACFTKLLSIFSVKTTFNTSDYYLALKRISELEEVNQRSTDIAIALVQAISDDDEFARKVVPMYAPGEDGVTKAVSEFVYDDTPWLGRHIPSKANLRYLHPKLSAAVAQKIGVHGVRAHLLKSTSDELSFKPIFEHEEFRQTESITKRLQSIIDMYPEGQQPFNELIQNADDAKATTVRFVVSTKQYGCSSLLGEGLQQWQGPALYCYNDSIFSEKDFANISSIGQTSKLESFDMTGRFGVGFNSVFNWTDCPSFISSDYLVIFDPHSKYLPERSGGVRIQFTKSASCSFSEHFPDQCQPFLMLGCNMKDNFHGTLFRFPFRNTTTAKTSEISQRSFDSSSLSALLDLAMSTLHHAILFLRHINNIELYVHDADDEQPRLVYQVTREWSCLTHDRDVMNMFDGLSKDAVYAKLATLSQMDTPMTDRKVRIFRNRFDTNTIINEDYLISSLIGKGECRNMALDPAHRSMKFLPWASIATPLGEHQNLCRGRLFCILPLPTEIGFPVHVNGNFELSSNRRDIWTGTDMIGNGKTRSRWNLLLVSEVVAPLYCHCLEVMRSISAGSEHYYSLWPVASSSDIWKTVQRNVYQYSMIQPLFRTDNHKGAWISGRQGVLYATETEQIPDMMYEMIPFLLEQAVPIVSIPRGLLSALKDANCTLNELNISTLSALVRIPNQLGQMVCAHELFDPSEPGICEIVDGSALPASSLCEPQSLRSLRHLGMKRKLSLQFILSCAKSLDKVTNPDKQIHLRASALLTFLDDADNFMDLKAESSHENAIEELRSLRWVPSETLTPREMNSELNRNAEIFTCLASPDKCRLIDDKALCDATYNIIGLHIKSQHMIQFFGWDKHIPAPALVAQIINLSLHHSSSLVDSRYIGKIARILPRLYELLDARLQEFSRSDDSLEALKSWAWIWVGDRFVTTNRVAINTHINAEPYLYTIPLEIRCFEHLMKATAIREQFTTADFINVLKLMATELNGKCCDVKQLELALLMCRLINRADFEAISPDEIFYLPTREGLICRASDAMYDDAPWLSEILGKKLKSRYLFVHDTVDRETARKLGARSLRETLSGQYSQGMVTIPCPKPEAIQLLLSRRKNREEYIRKVLSELVEVAERQGAKQVRLLFDDRTHENTSILHPCLAMMQGRSLMLYMDVPLEVADAVKLVSPAQCYNRNGSPRFGAGLCGTFLLTDCLQVLTKRSFLLFDPTGEYLFDDAGSKALNDNRTKRKPVARNYNLSLDIFKAFSDQFNPFLSAPFGLQESLSNSAKLPDGPFFNGTIIRIPFRSVCSPFSLNRDVFQESDIGVAMDNAKNMVPDACIFLQSLQSISIDHWSSSDTSYKNILDCQISTSQPILQTNIDHSRSSDRWTSSIMKFLVEKPRLSSYVVDVNHRETVDKFLICSFVFPIDSDKEWVGMKGNSCVSVAISLTMEKPLKIFDGSIFVSGFDTNINIGFPVHINAPLFLHEWSGDILMDADDDMDIKLALQSKREAWYHQWNQQCLSVAINQMMPSALETSTEYFQLHEDPRVMYCFWPFVRRVKMPFRQLVQDSLMKGLSSKTIFLKLDRFVSINNGYFEYPQKRAPLFFRKHSELFNVPKAVYDDIYQYTAHAACFSPATARKLLKKNTIKLHLLERPLNDVISVFEYCISDFVDDPGAVLSAKAIAICKNELIGLPLFCLSNGKVAEIGTSVILADSEQQYLLPKLVESGGFLASFTVKKWSHIIQKKGFLESCGIERFDHKILLRHISSVLPASFENRDIVSWDSHDDEMISPEKHPSRLWIHLFWKNVPIGNSTIVQSFRRWPLIPTVHNELISCSHYQYIVSARSHSMDADLHEAILINRNKVLHNCDDSEVPDLADRASNSNIDEFWTLGLLDVSSDRRTDLVEMISGEEAEQSVPNDTISAVLHDNGNPGPFDLDISTYDILCRLNCPMISSAYFSDCDLSRIDSHDKLSSTRIIMASLSFWMDKIENSGSSHLKWTILSPQDRCLLLQSLVYNSQMTRLSLSATDYSILRRLPLFETNDGSFSNLTQKGPTFVLESMVDYDSFQHILPRSITLLVDKQQFRDLYGDLQVIILTESLLIRKLLSQEFRNLPVEQRDAVVKILVSKWPRIREDIEHIRDDLSIVPFVRTKHLDATVYACPRQLYDPRNPFFRDIFDGASAYFPADEYNTDESLDFLVCAGMIKQVDKDSFLKAALIVEEEESVPKAMVLWQYFSSCHNDFHDTTNTFLPGLSRIKCVPAESESAEVGLHYFSDVAVPRDKNLSFTVLPTALECIVPPQFMFSRLHIASPPPLATVLQHLRILTDVNREKWRHTHATVQQVFLDMFSFLQDHLPKLSTRVVEGLKCRCMIPVIDGQIVKPEYVFFRLPKDLSPFIWELPRCFGSYEKLLRVLGVRESPSIDDCTFLLKGVYESKACLNINELNAVIDVFHLICGAGSSSLSYLPDQDGLIVPLDEILIDDGSGIMNTDRIDNRRIKLLHPALTEIGRDLGVDLISERIIEELADAPVVLFPQPEELRRMELIIKSPGFKNIFRNVADTQNVESMLSALKIVGVINLHTKFLLTSRESAVDITNYSSNLSSNIFFDGTNMFVSVSSALAPYVIATKLCNLFKVDHKHTVGIAALLSSSDSDTSTVAETILFQNITNAKLNRGSPGARLSELDLGLIEMLPSKTYRKGETVAVIDEGDAFMYGVVDSLVQGETSVLSRIRVQVSKTRFDDLLSSNVWSFKTGRKNEKSETPRQMELLSPTMIESRANHSIDNNDTKLLKSIGTDDIIQAVDELLSFANLSLTHEAQTVMESNLILAEKFERMKRYSNALTDSVTKLADSYLCPITREVMTDPVICSDGHTYERYAIERWLQTSVKSPKTNERLSSLTLIPNIAVRAAIESIQEVEQARTEFGNCQK